MPDAEEACGLTVVRARNRRLAKLVWWDGAIEGYDSARTVDLHPRALAGLAGLHKLLAALAHRTDCCIVRGAPIDPTRMMGVRRLVHPDRETGDEPTMRDVPRRWVALDLDGLPLPAGTDPRDLLACRTGVLPLLPAAFRDAAALVQATASHGIKAGARLRLWCWLSRATTGAELKAWLRGVPVDHSVFRAVQPIYTAAPIFVAQGGDPLPLRLAAVAGAPVVRVPAPEALAPRPRPLQPPRPLSDATRGGRYAMAALARAGAAIRQGEGGRHMVALREALGLARLIRAGVLSEGQVAEVIGAALDVPGRNTARNEAGDLVSWAMATAADKALPEGVRA